MKTCRRIFLYYVLFLLLFTIPVVSLSQDRLTVRKNDFYKTIEILRLHPERINLLAKSRQYNRDSLIVYYQDLQSKYSDVNKSLNRWQNTFWFYEIGLVQSYLDMTDSAIISFEKALKLVDENLNPKAYLRLKEELAYSYRQYSLYLKSNDIYREILLMPIVLKDTITQIHIKYFMAENYENLGQYQKSLELCQYLYDDAFQKGDFANASYNLIQIGRMAGYLEKDTSYFEYFHLANNLAKKSGVKRSIGNNFVSTGYAYSSAGLPIIALNYFNKGLKYTADFTMRDQLYCLSGLATTYLSLDSISQSYKYAMQSKQIASRLKGYSWMSESCEVLAGCYTKLAIYDSAMYYMLEASRLNKISGNESRTAPLYKKLSEISGKLKNQENAILYLDSSYISYKKFVSKKNGDRLAALRSESDYYIHKARITELISKNKSEKEKSKLFLILFSAISILLFLTIMFLVLRRKQLKKLKESYVGLVKKNIELDNLTTRLQDCDSRPLRKTRTESIRDEDIIASKLRKRLQKDEIFTDPDLSLKMLAEDLGTNTSYLSAIVNNHFNCNLKTLINRYRIDKARKMMVTNGYSHYSMDGIATEVGFKSRSGFYLAFKSVTGITPTLYIENYNLALIPSNDEAEIETASAIEY
jgi:AraC-like DNA-binding protein/tetratricopeptide (TPR) repeat protein